MVKSATKTCNPLPNHRVLNQKRDSSENKDETLTYENRVDVFPQNDQNREGPEEENGRRLLGKRKSVGGVAGKCEEEENFGEGSDGEGDDEGV